MALEHFMDSLFPDHMYAHDSRIRLIQVEFIYILQQQVDRLRVTALPMHVFSFHGISYWMLIVLVTNGRKIVQVNMKQLGIQVLLSSVTNVYSTAMASEVIRYKFHECYYVAITLK
jgi:hypothetical protein